jgi:hypothetical protein
MHKLISYTTIGTARLAANWMLSVQYAGLDDMARVYCGDNQSTVALSKFLRVTDSAVTVDTFEAEGGSFPERSEFAKWGTPEFGAIALAKLDLLLKLNDPAGFSPFVFCDADTVLRADPTEFLAKLEPAPLYMQNDNEHGEAPRPERFEYCSGLMVFNSPEVALLQCARFWLKKALASITTVEGGGYVDDQRAICRAFEFLNRVPKFLPVDYFPNGAMKWLPRALICHANWVRGIESKEAKLRSEGEWHLDPMVASEVGL